MKKVFPKLSLLVATLAVSSMASAKTEILSFRAEPTLVNPGSSLENVLDVKVSLDYDNKSVEITGVPPMPVCPVDRVCVQMMPPHYRMVLPIKSVTTDSCGIKKVVGLKDLRNVDGVFTKITLTEATGATRCMFVRAPDQKFQLTEKYFDRMSNQEVSITASYDITKIETPIQKSQFTLSKVLSFEGFGKLVPTGAGKLAIGKDQVELSMNFVTSCQPNQVCPQFVSLLDTKFKIEKIERSTCGDKIEAKKVIAATTSTVTETIELYDYQYTLCARAIPYLVEATYQKTEQSILPSTPVQTSKAELGFN